MGDFDDKYPVEDCEDFKPEGVEPDGFDDDGSEGYGDEYDFDDVYDAMYPNGRDDGYDD